MGAHYERWLITKGNVFSPAAASIAKLVDRLRKEKWVIDPQSPDLAKLRFEGAREQRAKTTGGYAVKTVENRFGGDVAATLAATTDELPAALTAACIDDPGREELRLVWPVRGDAPLPVKYPLSRVPEGAVSYALEIHRADEYVYPTSDSIGAVPCTCKCGEDLAFEWDEDELVPAFAASSGIFTECEECSNTFDPSKGSATITRPFDHKSEEVRGGAAYRFALKIDCGACFVADPALAFAPELVALLEAEFGRTFYEVARTT